MSSYPAQRTEGLTETEQEAVLNRFNHLVTSSDASRDQRLDEIRESLED